MIHKYKCKLFLFSPGAMGESDTNTDMSNTQVQIQLLESPIPAPPAAPVSQKASSDGISGTKRGTIDPLVSKRPEKF